MSASLITIYRNRTQHLQTQLTWWQTQRGSLSQDYEWIVVEANADPSPGLQEQLASLGVRYVHMQNPGILHKTKALNLGLQCAQGDYLAPFDVDLIPLGQTLQQQLHLATLSPAMLITGYRLMSPYSTIEIGQIDQSLAEATTAPEDQPTALRKHLLQGERFGVMPFFQCDRLRAIQGWDEGFIGWGAEDQDLLERYLGDTGYFCRSPQLVYLHLHHEAEAHWREDKIVAANRRKYYQKRSP